MSADLKRVRASQDEGHSTPASKRRALTPSGSGGMVAQAAEDEGGMEDWMRVVEVKRKEAIYRQMLEYRRSYETETRKVRELEEQQRRLEASVQAVEVCWTQLVNAVRSIVPDTGSSDKAALEPLLEPSLAPPALEQAISARLPATLQLINSFMDVASRNGARTSTEELQQRCSALQAESSTLRSANQTLQSQLSTSTEASERYRSDLARAQKRIDKQRMDHDLAEQEWRASRDRDRERTGTPGLKPRANGPVSGGSAPNGVSEDDIKPNLERSAGLLQDTTQLEQLADSRLKELLALRSEHTSLQNEHDKLRQHALHPSEEALRAAPFFQIYLHQISQQYSRAEAYQAQFEASESKLDNIRQDNAAFREAVVADCRVEADSLRKQVQTRNADLARIRGERDEMNVSLVEKTAREESRFKWVEEMEGLMKSREERIGALNSEVRRLRATLGAGQGSMGYLAFLKEEGVDGDYVKSLEAKFADNEGRISALSAATHSEASARADLEKAERALAKFERILGPDPTAAADAVQLAKQLEAADTEISTLRLKLDTAEANTNSLYTDVEALHTRAETLEKQLQSKVFDLRDVDARMNRVTTEKAKADNRYFQTMRVKDAVEAECKAAQRSVDKQLKLLARAQEVERGLQAQITAHEKSFVAVKNEASTLQTQLANTTAERTQYEMRYQQAQAALTDAQLIMQQRVAEAAAEKETRIKLQEEVDKATTALQKLKDRQEHLIANSSKGGGGTSATELQMKDERDKLLKLLRCSCCEQNFKQQVIVKCMHTFCKPCLDSRVASRQRKCPACGLSFAKEDVQTLYWQ